MTVEKKLIKCYELDFGDTNLISPSISQILAWIKTDALDLKKGDEPLEYKLSIKFMTKKKYENLPEWS